VARNEDGEFELVLGNRQLLSVFFLMALLLGICFVLGFIVGRSAGPALSAGSLSPAVPLPARPTTPEPEPPAVRALPPEPEPAPVSTMPQAEPEPPRAELAKPEPARTEPPKAEVPRPPAPKAEAAKLPPAIGQPIPGRIYLQLSATDQDKAGIMADLLRSKNLPGFAAPIPERPGLYRVLVGPLSENAVQDMRAQLKAHGFPADEAIRRVF
jgi:cell division septation protein DedD